MRRGDELESPRQRTTRKWNEMLQELRVAQTGVQGVAVLVTLWVVIPLIGGERDDATEL